MTLRDEVEAYLTACEDEGHSPRTLDRYKDALRRNFYPWAEEQGLDSLDDLTDATLAAYRTQLARRPNQRKSGELLSRSSVHSYMRPLRSMLNHYRLGLLVKLPKLGRQVKTVITREEQQRLENACRCDRDRLMVWLMGRRAVRATELTLIKEEDLISIGRQRFLRIHGKGAGGNREERAVPITNGVWRQLWQLAERDGHGYVFHGKGRRGGSYRPLTRSGVGQMTNIVAREAGVIKDGRPVSPHDLRHSVITFWFIEKDYGMGHIMEIAGNHTALDGYIHLRQNPGALADLDWD